MKYFFQNRVNIHRIVFIVLMLGGALLVINYLIYIRNQANPKKKMQIVFYDDFSEEKLDASKWTTCYEWYSIEFDGCSNNGNKELQWYKSNRVRIQDGNLVLVASRGITPGWDGKTKKDFYFESGMVSTGRRSSEVQPKWASSYGRYEARIKVPSGKGLWPAFWLLPVENTWPPEIDIMELVGDKPNEILLTYHYDTYPNQKKDESKLVGDDFTKDWHIYAIDWQPERIQWFVDEKLVKQATGKNIPSQPMQIIFNLAVGGNLAGYPDDTTVLPAEMLVDYVKVEQMN
ncbi:glycoside hydrolase family 16 protein [Candidatus Saccharibacteria bacterium]|nr:glycoside hydrolase family 16 protein [Candidatus Saccharibacteria bacterium]